MALKSPNTVPVPDEIFDWWLTRLGEAELKILLYIVRRTLGFYKRSDQVSLSQFQSGIKDLDSGTGLGKSAVSAALKSLEGHGLIERTRQESEASGHLPTAYSVLWDPLPLSIKADKPLSTPDKGPLSTQPDIQETVLQETDTPPTPPQAGGERASDQTRQTPPADIVHWIEAECTRLQIKPGFQPNAKAKAALREADSPGLREQIGEVLRGHAYQPRNVTALITGLVPGNGRYSAPTGRFRGGRASEAARFERPVKESITSRMDRLLGAIDHEAIREAKHAKKRV